MKRVIGGEYTDQISALEAENREVAYEAAVESMVLLKNDGGLPFHGKEVALFGVGADYTIKGGTGSGEVNNRHSVSILEGLTEAGITVSTMAYLKEYREKEEACHKKWIKENTRIPSAETAMINYKQPEHRPVNQNDFESSTKDMAVYVVSRQSGEGADKKIADNDFDLTALEVNDIRYLSSCFKHLCVVINSGTSMDLSPIDDLNLSLVFYGQAGQEGGRAFADLLSGKANFSGKLSTTWVKKYSDIPFGAEFSYLNQDLNNEYYKEGIYVGYRYYDSFRIPVRFPFGYGLSYTTFDILHSNLQLDGCKIVAEVTLKNTGLVKGSEVVQLYAALPKGRLHKEVKRLIAFKKSRKLSAMEEETLTLTTDISALASFEEERHAFVLEAGNYVLLAGNSSAHTMPFGYIEVREEVSLSEHDGILRTTEKVDQLKNETPLSFDLKGLKHLTLDPSSVKKAKFRYGKPEVCNDPKVTKILDSLTDEEMAKVCCGIGTMGMMNTSVFCTPGVAGKTTYEFLDRGLLSVNLADGPGGLRLVRKSAVSKNGMIKMFPGNYLLSFMETMPKWMLSILKPSKKDTVFYQNATAFPVGTNLAQTWNEALLEKVGNAVSKEMNQYNVTYWLAPGMNIQRNPLCGRNFEYYSEDPLLTGKISASMTRGVQSTPGNYTTIKHFACNNAEDNRIHSNSHVSERALREIYLKGFEINIKEAGSKSVMTSYNMINSVYTPDSYDLCTKVLRNEWGFEGVVMTDWYSTKPGQGHTDFAIANGNDMIMPGDKVYQKTILNGLKHGVLTREDLRRAAGNIIRSIVYSHVATKYRPKDFLDEK